MGYRYTLFSMNASQGIFRSYTADNLDLIAFKAEIMTIFPNQEDKYLQHKILTRIHRNETEIMYNGDRSNNCIN